jgi:hypothetical protein
MLHTAHQPSAKAQRTLAYDAASHRDVLAQMTFWALNLPPADTWTWDGQDWSLAWTDNDGQGPSDGAPVFPIAVGPGGTVLGFAAYVYRWTGARWASTGIIGTPETPAAVAFDPATGRDLVVAGTSLYVFDGTHFTKSALPATLQNRTGEGFAAATRAGQDAVLWGGEVIHDNNPSNATPLSDTWVYAAGGWRHAAS